MEKYIVLCDYDIRWSHNLKQYMNGQNICFRDVDSFEDAEDEIVEGCSIVMCSWLEAPENIDFRKFPAPVVIVSDSILPGDEINALNRGAAEYVHRYDGMEIISARINRVFEYLYMQIIARTNFLEECDTEIIKLTEKEKNVLHILMENEGSLVSREKLENELWSTYKNGSRALDKVIGNLRKKICSQGIYIENTYGKGYRLRGHEGAYGKYRG